MEKLSNNELKHELTIMLEWINSFCKRYDIYYSPIAGTLIGIVRHKGFIPWDDDIDLGVLRKDYERLLELRDTLVSESDGLYDIVAVELNNSEFPFIKFINKHIKVKQVNVETSVDYLWIDVFPLDKVPEEKSSREKQCKQTHRYRLLLESAIFKAENITHYTKSNSVKKLLHPILNIVGAPYFGRVISRIASRFENTDSNLVCEVVWGYGDKETVRIEEFLKSKEAEFEGVKVQIMSCWDDYLTQTYGDYMTLPDPSKRVSHEVNAWRIE